MAPWWVLGLMLALGAAGPAWAEWPEHPITLLVAYAAGGGTDVAARSLARHMERELGQSIVVVNRPGAGGEIGFTELARSRPDGYTIGFINTPNIVTNPIERRTRYSLDDFAPIANVVDDPGGFFVLSRSPFHSLADLVAAAKRDPGGITYGTTGIGSDDHLAALAMERLAGIQLTHVPFNGSSEVRNAVLGGTIVLGSLNMGEGIADLRQGVTRALGQMGTSRWSEAPDTPTFREQGFDVVEGSMRGLAAPAGMPRPILDRLAAIAKDVVVSAAFRQQAAQQALPLRYLGPDEYRSELLALRAHYEALWRQHPWRE